MSNAHDITGRARLDGHWLFVNVQNFSRRKAIEPGGRGAAVCSDVLRINQVVDLQLGQFFRKRDLVQRVAGLPEDRRDLFGYLQTREQVPLPGE